MGSFNVSNYKRQVVVAAKMNEDVLAKLEKARSKNPGILFTFHISVKTPLLNILDGLLKEEAWVGDIFEGLPKDYGSVLPPFRDTLSYLSFLQDCLNLCSVAL